MTYSTVKLEKMGRFATLSLNRPDAMNSMDGVMMKELADCFEVLLDDKEVQVLLIKGEGKVFSAGGDIKAMVSPDSPLDISKVMVDISRFVTALYQLPMVTVAAIHGASAGLGLSLALGCDTVIAEENSKVAMNFIGIGLVPDGGGHFFMKERVGVPKAKQLIWTGKVMNANEAQQIGLIDEVVEDGKVFDYAEILVKKLLSSPIAAMIETKQIYHAQKLQELKETLEMEAVAQVNMRKSQDHLEGIQAFVGKRKPHFQGK